MLTYDTLNNVNKEANMPSTITIKDVEVRDIPSIIAYMTLFFQDSLQKNRQNPLKSQELQAMQASFNQGNDDTKTAMFLALKQKILAEKQPEASNTGCCTIL